MCDTQTYRPSTATLPAHAHNGLGCTEYGLTKCMHEHVHHNHTKQSCVVISKHKNQNNDKIWFIYTIHQ